MRQLRGARLRGDCNSDGGAKEVPSRQWDGDWCWHAAHQAWGSVSLGRPGGGHEIGRHRANGGGDLGIRTSRIADDDVSLGTSGIQVFSSADRIGFYKNRCFQTRDRYTNRRPSVWVFRSWSGYFGLVFFCFLPRPTSHIAFAFSSFICGKLQSCCSYQWLLHNLGCGVTSVTKKFSWIASSYRRV